MFMYTLARKVNCKLGGINVQLAEQLPTAINKNFMLVVKKRERISLLIACISSFIGLIDLLAANQPISQG